MSFYAGGVFNDPACGYGEDAELVHAVLCIGYGHDMDYGDYWIVKNSWSNAWGMDGYIYIKDENDLCGVLQEPVFYEIDRTPKVETEYEFNGTFSLPYANVTQKMRVVYDEEK